MIVQRIVNGKWKQNCYVFGTPGSDALVLDPGSEPDRIVDEINAHNLDPKAIILTHAHYDHVGAIADIQDKYGIETYMCKGDARLLRHANMYSTIFGSNEKIRIPDVAHMLDDFPSTFQIASFDVEWMPTPGHTAGSVCFTINGHLFTGDTLMGSGAGRTDLPGGDANEMITSIEKISQLNGELTVMPGHGSSFKLQEFVENH